MVTGLGEVRASTAGNLGPVNPKGVLGVDGLSEMGAFAAGGLGPIDVKGALGEVPSPGPKLSLLSKMDHIDF